MTFSAVMPIVHVYICTRMYLIGSPVHFTIPGLLSQVRIVRSHLQNNNLKITISKIDTHTQSQLPTINFNVQF